jgi:hypothetical protein
MRMRWKPWITLRRTQTAPTLEDRP